MERKFKIIDENLVLIKDILSVNIASDEVCEFMTKNGKLTINGSNLEILKYDMFIKSMILSGNFYNIN